MAVMALVEVEEEADTCLLPPRCKLCSASYYGGQSRSSSSLSLRHSPMYCVCLLLLFSQNCWADEMRWYNTLANIHFFFPLSPFFATVPLSTAPHLESSARQRHS